MRGLPVRLGDLTAEERSAIETRARPRTAPARRERGRSSAPASSGLRAQEAAAGAYGCGSADLGTGRGLAAPTLPREGGGGQGGRMDPNPMFTDDCVGPGGRLRLRCCLPRADTISPSTYCCGPDGCRRTALLDVQEAIRLMGTAEATKSAPLRGGAAAATGLRSGLHGGRRPQRRVRASRHRGKGEPRGGGQQALPATAPRPGTGRSAPSPAARTRRRWCASARSC